MYIHYGALCVCVCYTEHLLSAGVWPVQCEWNDCHHSIPHDSLVSDQDTANLFNLGLQDRNVS